MQDVKLQLHLHVAQPYLHAKQQAQLVNDALAIVAEQSGESK